MHTKITMVLKHTQITHKNTPLISDEFGRKKEKSKKKILLNFSTKTKFMKRNS